MLWSERKRYQKKEPDDMSKKVMVVDDSRIVQLQLQKILSDTEYEVVACCQSG